MDDEEIRDAIDNICRIDKGYDRNAYRFILFAIDSILAPKADRTPIAGKEFLTRTKECMVDYFGRLAPTVAGEWGIYSGSDLGEVVFNLIKVGALPSNQGDKKSDFDDDYFMYDLLNRWYRSKDTITLAD